MHLSQFEIQELETRLPTWPSRLIQLIAGPGSWPKADQHAFDTEGRDNWRYVVRLN